MNWVECLNNNLHHKPSEKPRESPTTATDVRPRTWRGTKNTLVFTTQQTTLSLVLVLVPSFTTMRRAAAS